MTQSNRTAFLDMLAISELGKELLDVSDNGYNVIVGSTPKKPILFNSYAAHPNRLIGQPLIKVGSTAAGRYQILYRYWSAYRQQLNLDDKTKYPDGPMGKAAQDAIALQQIKECQALDDIDAGRFQDAVEKCAHIWASLPSAGYGQRENKLTDLQAAFIACGGKIA